MEKLTESIVSFEVAKLAQEKGFYKEAKEHGKVFGSWYNERGVECGRTDVDDKGAEINFKSYGSNYKNHYLKSYYAPAQSLLQKWLRKKQGIEIYIKKHHSSYSFVELTKYNEVDDENESVYLNGLEWEYFDVYEKALNSGLKEALELIEL